MAKAFLLSILGLLIIAIFSCWVALWLLKPTNFWTRRWKEAEDSARLTVFGYYSLNFAVFTFPIIALAIFGRVYLNILPRIPPRLRQARSPTTGFSNPVIANSFVGILSTKEILAVSFFIFILAWTYYTRISNDFKKMTPIKSLKLNLWQLKYLRIATRFGLLAEACLALLLLPVLRGLALFQLLGIQFEASVRYHIWLGTSLILFATIHGASTLLVWGVSHHIQDEVWRWQKTGRIYLAGEITLVIGLVIWITSLPQIRRKRFEIFYYTHHLYMVFLLFFLFHAGDRHFYTVFAGIFLFGLDKLFRIVQSKPITCILSARVFPSKAIELTLPKDPSLKYTPTSVIYIKIPRISKFQWHPFSITSASNVDNQLMTILIKCEEGWTWTNSLHDMLEEELQSGGDHANCIPISIEGPYGPATLDFQRYGSLLLIAGGIGITPFLSLLKEIDSDKSSGRNRYPTRIQLIYIVKKSQDICLLDSMSHLLLQHSTERFNLKLKVYVTQEERSNATIRELLSDMSLVHTVTFGTTCSNYAAHGLDNSLWTAAMLVLSSIIFLAVLIGFNHIFASSEKKGAATSEKVVMASEKKPSKEKTPSSSVFDLLLLSSFIIALACSTFAAVIFRWKRINKGIPPVSLDQGKEATDSSSLEAKNNFDEHEIHFGGRPNFEDVLNKFHSEAGGANMANIGVLVCGPEAMKESAASACKLKSRRGLNIGAEGKKPRFNYHSLNFTL